MTNFRPRSLDNKGLTDKEMGEEGNLQEIIEAEILRAFDDYGGGPVSLSDIQQLLSMPVTNSQIKDVIAELIDSGLVTQVYYNMYSISNTEHLFSLDSIKKFMDFILEVVDQSILFYSTKHEAYFRVSDSKGFREVNKDGFSRVSMSKIATQEALQERFFPVCSICTGRINSVLLNYYVENHQDSTTGMICYNCQDKLTKLPYIQKVEVIRRLIRSMRASYKAATRLQRDVFPVDEKCVMNFDLLQLYLFKK